MGMPHFFQADAQHGPFATVEKERAHLAFRNGGHDVFEDDTVVENGAIVEYWCIGGRCISHEKWPPARLRADGSYKWLASLWMCKLMSDE